MKITFSQQRKRRDERNAAVYELLSLLAMFAILGGSFYLTMRVVAIYASQL